MSFCQKRFGAFRHRRVEWLNRKEFCPHVVNFMRVANDLKTYLISEDALLPTPQGMEEAIKEILALHEANGGATYNLYFGSLSGARLYAVSVFPERSFITEGRHVSQEEIAAYIHANQDLLSDPRCCVGTWYSTEFDQTYLDISITLPNKRTIAMLGKRYNQEGVFDLFRMEYIPTGGSGEPPEIMPPAAERLPPLQRGRGRLS